MRKLLIILFFLLATYFQVSGQGTRTFANYWQSLIELSSPENSDEFLVLDGSTVKTISYVNTIQQLLDSLDVHRDSITVHRSVLTDLLDSISVLRLLIDPTTEEDDTENLGVTSFVVYNSFKSRLYFSENEAQTLTTNGWSLSADSGSVVVVFVDGTNNYFTLSRDIEYGENVTVYYSPAAGETTDAAGNELDSLSASVTNNVVQAAVSVSYTDTIEAEDYTGSYLYHQTVGDSILKIIERDGWVKWNGDFGNTDTLILYYSKYNVDRDFEIRLNNSSGTLLYSGELNYTGGWDTYQYDTLVLNEAIDGNKDIFILAKDYDPMRLDRIIFNVDTTDAAPGSEPSGSGLISQINTLLGKGLNAHNLVEMGVNTAEPTWNLDYYDTIADAGFNSLRICFYGFQDNGSPNYTIPTYILENMKEIFDSTISAGMIPILDHHTAENWFDNWSSTKLDRWLSYWYQWANYFKDYPIDELVFELANEPRTISASQWNSIASQLVDTIRAADVDRPIMITPINTWDLSSLNDLTMPSDTMMILSIHYYKPNWLSWQGWPWGSSKYLEAPGSSWYPIEPLITEITTELDTIVNYAATNNVPVNIGEWGIVTQADYGNRERYMNFMSRYFETKGWSWHLWEFNDWFGVYKDGIGWQTGLRDALISDAYPDTMTYSDSIVYEADFSSTTDGWTENADITLSVSNDSLVCVVNSATGTPNESIVYSPVFGLTKNKTYKITYVISHNGTKAFMADKLGSDYAWHNIYNLDGTEYTRVTSFVHAYDTDSSAKMGFLLGSSTGTFYVEEFKIEEIYNIQ